MRATPPDSQEAPPPAPSSTLHSLGTAIAFGSDGGAGPADHPRRASASKDRQQQTLSRACANPNHAPLASSTCKTRIPSLPPVLVVDRISTRLKLVVLIPPPPASSSLPQFSAPVYVKCCESVSFRSPGLHLELVRDPSWKTCIQFYLPPLVVLAHAILQTNVGSTFTSTDAGTRCTPAGVPIPSSPSPPPQSSTHLPGDLSTAPTSFLAAPPTIVSLTVDTGGHGRTPEMRNEGAGCTERYALATHAGVHAFSSH